MNSHSDRIIDLYERHALDYDVDRGRALAIERPWLDRFTKSLADGASILDIGCGSGEPIGRYLIENRFAVTGVDSSPTLIGFCRRRFPDREWIVADMRTLDLGRTFQGVIAWDSLFHLSHDDQRQMFGVFRKHSAPAAALLFTSGSSHDEGQLE